ncbi:cyclodeaminase/cyclohydrolase family protein [Nonomuraea sp. SBT364]|uniref:cyclodeaminase/cyclohydrolase family protein n=1 Tax=Nonomuraea sp. SBT364 TaxID=1580530 RepID=UPI00066CC44D|nr:cyclodeaminase/cyclohydrolase family protein [Nonomuraea sp. SBT364]
MRDSTINGFLSTLADRVPAPGGGATAALHTAQAAALLGMVARYTTGEKYAEHAPTVEVVIAETDALRESSLELAEADAAAFTAVTDAYRLPKGGERTAAIARALAGAAEPPARVAQTAEHLLELCEVLLRIGNRNLLTDVAAAAEAARAALATSRVNVEVNLAGLADSPDRDRLRDRIAFVDEALARADAVTSAVLKEIRA